MKLHPGARILIQAVGFGLSLVMVYFTFSAMISIFFELLVIGLCAGLAATCYALYHHPESLLRKLVNERNVLGAITHVAEMVAAHTVELGSGFINLVDTYWPRITNFFRKLFSTHVDAQDHQTSSESFQNSSGQSVNPQSGSNFWSMSFGNDSSSANPNGNIGQSGNNRKKR
jgi:hypothetical protein